MYGDGGGDGGCRAVCGSASASDGMLSVHPGRRPPLDRCDRIGLGVLGGYGR